MNSAKLKDHQIRIITQASVHQQSIALAGTYALALGLIDQKHVSVRQRGRELMESIFWMGGAIEKAHSLSQSGDRFFDKLRRDTGITEAALRRALNVWDVFDGDIVKLYHWYTSTQDAVGKVLIRHLDEMVRTNKDVIDERADLRKIKGTIEREGLKGDGVQQLKLVTAKRKSKLKAVIPGTVKKKVDLPEFKPITTLVKAKEKLIFEPDEKIPIARVSLSDGSYTMIVTLVKDEDDQ